MSFLRPLGNYRSCFIETLESRTNELSVPQGVLRPFINIKDHEKSSILVTA